MTAPAGATLQLAGWAAALRYADLPAPVAHEARRCLLDFLGVAIGAANHPAIDAFLQAARAWNPHPQASVLGRHERIDLPTAALVNGAMAHLHDFDDTHLGSIVHPSAPVWPAILALAEAGELPGERCLAAFVAGFEVETRAGAAVVEAHEDGAYHATGVFGPLGAATACASLLDLSPEQTAMAISLAASQGAGLRAQFGTMAKSFQPGNAARAGLVAALLAQAGLTASMTALESERGLLAAVSLEHRHPERLVERLGEGWEILHNSVKPYSCGAVTHPLIDGVIQLRRELSLGPDDITSIEARVCPLVVNLTGLREPTTGLEGKFSAYHCAAVALVDGACLPAQFEDRRVTDPVVARVRRLVTLRVDPDLREHEAHVTIQTTDGRSVSAWVPHHRGTPENPIDDEGLRDKFRGLAGPTLGPHRPDALIAVVERFDQEASPRPLLDLCRP